MIISLIRQGVHPIEFFLSQRRHGLILNQHLIAVSLLYQLSSYMILLVLLYAAGDGIFLLALDNVFIARTLRARKRRFRHVADITGTPDITHCLDVFARVKSVGYLNHLIFAHAVDEEIRLRVEHYRSAYFIVPIVIMCKSAQ